MTKKNRDIFNLLLDYATTGKTKCIVLGLNPVDSLALGRSKKGHKNSGKFRMMLDHPSSPPPSDLRKFRNF